MTGTRDWWQFPRRVATSPPDSAAGLILSLSSWFDASADLLNLDDNLDISLYICDWRALCVYV